jgi:hypothetical protein
MKEALSSAGNRFTNSTMNNLYIEGTPTPARYTGLLEGS